MKRIVAAMGLVWVVFALSSLTWGQDSAGEAAAPSPRPPTAERQGAVQAQQVQKLQQRIEEARAAHQSLIEALEALHATAVRERAAQTAKQIETLITDRQTAFQETLRQMEQEEQQLLRTVRNRPLRPNQPEVHFRQAPDFEATSFDGKKIKLADYKGHLVVLEWLNPDCPYCRYHYETAKTMLNTAHKFQSQHVIWLAVNSSARTTPEANRDFAQKYKVPYPILDDRSGNLARLYGARTTPHLFVIDKEGHLVYDGAIDNAPLGKKQPSAGKLNYVDRALAELVAGHQVSLPNTPPYGTPVKPGR